MIKTKPVKIQDYQKVIDMLQSISDFIPRDEDINDVWEAFISQDNLNGFSFFLDNELVGYGSVFYEIKIRGGKACHIEDIVVNENARGNKIGQFIIDYLVKEALKNNCYKVSLSCKENNIGFYEKCGFVQDGITMQRKL
jgi:glucosamine-phosphate N-acetyltransferase